MDFLALSQQRYTTKHYDGNRKISQEHIDMLLEILRLTPSAVNIQPWHFYVGSSDAAKNLIRPCVLDFNHARLDGCSHFIVLCAKTSVSDEEFSAITKKEDADGRYSKVEVKNSVDEHRRYFADMHVKMGDFNEWTAKQTYLAMAALLYGAASLGIDSTPIEGMDYEKCDEILKLKEKSLRSVGIVTLGYRAKDDSNAKRPKSRLDKESIISFLE
jgi:nitroreductase/dihydropteridine reductase